MSSWHSLDHFENRATNTLFMRETPVFIGAEKALHRSFSLLSPDITFYRQEGMSNKPIVPHENDVLMGRGGKNNQHIGNEKLRELARSECENYRVASKKGKSYISRELVKKIREMTPPGRFLKRNPKSGEWEDVGDEVGREKASQVLRDAVSAVTGNVNTGSKDVSESTAGSDDEDFESRPAPEPVFSQGDSDAGVKRPRIEPEPVYHWPDPPRSSELPSSTLSYQHPQSACLPVTPVSSSRPKRPRYSSDTFHYDDQPLQPPHPPPPPPPPPAPQYRHHVPAPIDHPVPQRYYPLPQPNYPYEYVPPAPRYPRVDQQSYHSRSFAAPPSGSPGSAVYHDDHHSEVNEFELIQGELLESDDEAKQAPAPDIH